VSEELYHTLLILTDTFDLEMSCCLDLQNKAKSMRVKEALKYAENQVSLSYSRYIYSYCQTMKETAVGDLQFETRTWCPVDLGLQSIAQSLIDTV